MLKRYFGHLRPLEMNAVIVLFSLPFFLVMFLFVDTPELAPGFWPTMSFTIPLNALGMVLHMTAINLSPLSLTMPYLAFTPAFVAVIAFLALGEAVTLVGVAGIVLIMLGSYVLNMGGGMSSAFDPFKAIFRERGSLFMLLAAMIYAVTAVFSKKVAMQSSPVFAALVYFTILNGGLLLIFFLSGKVKLKNVVKRPLPGLLAGFFLAAHVTSHFVAVTMVATVYMISIKRISGVFSVAYGKLWFGDKNIGFRMLGAVFMAAGAAVIAILG